MKQREALKGKHAGIIISGGNIDRARKPANIYGFITHV
jgi:hypothetical protein